MAKRFIKSTINWTELQKRVPNDQMTNFYAFKGKADVYRRLVDSNPPEPPKINWEEYQKSVPIPGLVDKFKSAYETFKVPYPEDTLSVKVDEQWKTLETEIKGFCAEKDKEIAHANKEVARIKALPPYESMTMEMYYDLFPNEALDPVNRPTFWPHTPDEQENYISPEEAAAKKLEGH